MSNHDQTHGAGREANAEAFVAAFRAGGRIMPACDGRLWHIGGGEKTPGFDAWTPALAILGSLLTVLLAQQEATPDV